MASSIAQPEPPKIMHLPQELCDLITKVLDDPRDGLALRLVCKSFARGFWRCIIDAWSDNRWLPTPFHERQFSLIIDDIGIRDIEALARSPFADQVRRIIFKDRFPDSTSLGQTWFCSRTRWYLGEEQIGAEDEYPRTKPQTSGFSPWGNMHEQLIVSGSGRSKVIVQKGPDHDRTDEEAQLYLQLPFYKLLPQEGLSRPGDFVFDYRFEVLNRRAAEYCCIHPSAETLARLSAVLPTFVNLESIGTARGDVVIVNLPLERDLTCEDQNDHEEANMWNKGCLEIPLGDHCDDCPPLVVLPAYHDLAAIMSPQIHTPIPALTLTELDFTIYSREMYPNTLSFRRNGVLLAKLITSCSRLKRLTLSSGPNQSPEIHFRIDCEIRHIVKLLNVSKPMQALERLVIHHCEPNSYDLITLLRRHKTTLEEVLLCDTEPSPDYADWVAFFTTTMAMQKLRVLEITTASCVCYRTWLYSSEELCVHCLWGGTQDLTDAKVVLPILEDLREAMSRGKNAED